MKIKKFSFVDVGVLGREVRRLELTPGVNQAFGASSLSDIGIMGDAWFILKIEPSLADKIWTFMGMSKDDTQSAYNDLMANEDIGAYSSVMKYGGFFSASYVQNFALTYDGMQVRVGSCAAKTPIQLIDKTHEFLIGNKRLYQTTDEAMKAPY